LKGTKTTTTIFLLKNFLCGVSLCPLLNQVCRVKVQRVKKAKRGRREKMVVKRGRRTKGVMGDG